MNSSRPMKRYVDKIINHSLDTQDTLVPNLYLGQNVNRVAPLIPNFLVQTFGTERKGSTSATEK